MRKKGGEGETLLEGDEMKRWARKKRRKKQRKKRRGREAGGGERRKGNGTVPEGFLVGLKEGLREEEAKRISS
jgi:hypothetical protein